METESNKLKDENEFLEKELQQKVLLLKRMERELEIEASLERVRTRSMAMNRSEELLEIAELIYHEVIGLNVHIEGVGFSILNTENTEGQWFVYNGFSLFKRPVKVNMGKDKYLLKAYLSWKNGEDRMVNDLEGDELQMHNQNLMSLLPLSEELIRDEALKKAMEQAVDTRDRHLVYHFNFVDGVVFFSNGSPIEEVEVLGRFFKVFEQTYTRFLDLKKAEAQAREAQIEAALERIRAASMAMHKSEELPQVALTLLAQIEKLALPVLGVAIPEVDAEKDTVIVYFADNTKEVGTQELTSTGEFMVSSFWQSEESVKRIKSGEQEFTIIADADRIRLWIEFVDEWISKERASRLRAANFSKVYFHFIQYHGLSPITISSLGPLTEEHQSLIRRLVATFAMSYRRYLDLKKAEAQAREAQIEAALERIRAASMAMHKSEELPNVALTLLAQIEKLALPVLGVAISEVDAEKETAILYFADNTKEGTQELTSTREFEINSFWQSDESFKRTKSGEQEFTLIAEAERIHLWIDFVDKWISKERASRLRAANLSKVYFHYVIHHELSAIVISSLGPLTEEHQSLIRRLVATFAMSYRRYLDLKKAEAQAREAQIEASLERIRASTMAMHHSQELLDAAKILFLQFEELGIELDVCGFSIMEKDSPAGRQFLSIGGTLFPEPLPVSYDTDPQLKRAYNAWKERQSELILDIQGEELKQHLAHNLDFLKKSKAFDLLSNTAAKFNDNKVQVPNRLVVHHAYFKDGYLFVTSRKPIENSEILLRFAKVFEQTYTRFLDLQKVEAQAREAQIEAALERIRAASMAMHHSSALPDVALVLVNQLEILGVSEIGSSISLVNEEKKTWRSFAADTQLEDGKRVLREDPELSIDSMWITQEAFRRRKAGENNFTIALTGQQLNEFVEYTIQLNGNALGRNDVSIECIYLHFAAFDALNSLVCASLNPFDEEAQTIVRRMSNTFGMSYRRFKDLQKAEAQAREAHIEAALERVRARSMAMRKSEELSEVASVLFQQLTTLDLEPKACAFIIYDEAADTSNIYFSLKGKVYNQSLPIPNRINQNLLNTYQAWKAGEELQFHDLTGEALRHHNQSVNDYLISIGIAIPSEVGLDEIKRQVDYHAFFTHGLLLFNYTERIKETAILVRFAKVFDQTYTRFLDLKNAEAQAREAQIEAALERVRSRALAMHSSEELPEVLDVVFTQMQALDFSSFHTVLGILNSEKNIFETWSKGVGAYSFPSRFLIPITDHPHFKIFLKGFEDGVAFHSFISSGKTLRSWDDYLFSLPEMKHIPEEVKKNYYEVKEAHFSMAYMKSAILFADGQEPLSPDQISTLKRFASVLDLTLTRMQDLQKAELQAREAIKQASLDRVRAEIASMRSTEDLQRITPLIWHELTVLGVPFFRCGVFILDEAQEIVHSYLSTPEGHSLAVMEMPFDVNEMTTQVVAHWKQNRVFKEHWDKEQFVSWMQSMVQQHRLQNPTEYQASPTPPESLFLHFIPFKQGMLYVGSTEVLSEDEIELVQTLAAAFSIAYARYEDFKQLEEAKTKVEATLDELKSTQAQLIQSEKMASLGELTAGIAHEIQNPLNFVNNYSEVNVELIEEIKEEIEKGNALGILELVTDLEDNETKIVHHGKRADAIVRGMLQHSRTNSGTKEPTDLNALTDEYLRLSYHGLRAKDSSFQADYSTDFDENLPLVEVVPQDIGRVLLNVINNAFQACHERCCAQIHPDYAPKVTISTQNRGEFIEIRIQDNGGGIPEAIKDKIFQPFFTTKPTGQGTGLGLSLAYDSVKAHGGELSVESNEGEGTTFILSLPL